MSSIDSLTTSVSAVANSPAACWMSRSTARKHASSKIESSSTGLRSSSPKCPRLLVRLGSRGVRRGRSALSLSPAVPSQSWSPCLRAARSHCNRGCPLLLVRRGSGFSVSVKLGGASKGANLLRQLQSEPAPHRLGQSDEHQQRVPCEQQFPRSWRRPVQERAARAAQTRWYRARVRPRRRRRQGLGRLL